MTKQVYRTSRGWGGWVLGLVFAVPFAAFGLAVVEMGVVMQSAMLYAVFGYVIAVVVVNRSDAEVSGEGIVVRYGPLPTGEGEFRVARSDVKRVYVRRQSPGAKSSRVYWHAGVETRGGQWVDLGEPAKAEEEAEAIAKALGWRAGVERLSGDPPRGRGMALRMSLRLAAMLVLAGVWAGWVG